MTAAVLLISLAAGYGVLVLSQNQPRPLDAIGRGVGGLILLVALIGLVCSAVCGMKCHRMMMGCGSKMSCPMSRFAPSQPAAPVEAPASAETK